jgi:DUF1680 family protein
MRRPRRFPRNYLVVLFSQSGVESQFFQELRMNFGPVDTTRSPHARLRTIPLDHVRLAEGSFWRQPQRRNIDIGLPHGHQMLDKFGTFFNIALAAGEISGNYIGPRFVDSDFYKWLEAVSYARADLHEVPERLVTVAEETLPKLARVQRADGYLNTFYQVVKAEEIYENLAFGHELYCGGHLIQVAIAHARSTGSNTLLDVARKYADHVDATFGPRRREGLCGHPEIEYALIELYRQTREQRYLTLAKTIIDRRGRRLLGPGEWHNEGSVYFQDHIPVRDATEVAGHAVRQLYLLAGVADLYLETGEAALMTAMQRQWADMTGRKQYLTGGVGSRPGSEAFGKPYELQTDLAYCETCASIAIIHWAWRLLLATGESRFADMIERCLFNGLLPGVSLDGTRYFYTNPLTSRGGIDRPEWFGCACCPPNVMRTLSSLQSYFVTTDDHGGLQLHQYFAGTIQGGGIKLSIEGRYPYDGKIKLQIIEAEDRLVEIALRIPSWCVDATLSVNGALVPAAPDSFGYARVRGAWRAGDRIELTIPITPRFTRSDPRVDATMNSIAVERGPLVYCFEQIDQPENANVLFSRIDVGKKMGEQPEPWLGSDAVAITASAAVEPLASDDAPLYQPLNSIISAHTELRAVPYYAWANRGAGAMRVWMPRMTC